MGKKYSKPHGRRIPAVPTGLRVGGRGSLVEDLGLVSLWTSEERDEQRRAVRLVRVHARGDADAALLLDVLGLTGATG